MIGIACTATALACQSEKQMKSTTSPPPTTAPRPAPEPTALQRPAGRYTAWPTLDCRLTNETLSVWAAWWLGEGPAVLRPLLGRELRKDGQFRGVVDEHGVGVTCAKLDGSLKTAA